MDGGDKKESLEDVIDVIDTLAGPCFFQFRA